jgi:Tol biopolymer transport system component
VKLIRVPFVIAAVAALAAPAPPVSAYARPGVTVRVSVGPNGAQSNGASVIDQYANASRVALSADGRYVAYESSGTNLVAGDTNHAPDIFVHDVVRHTTVRASVSSTGVQGSLSPAWTGVGPAPLCSVVQPARSGTGAFSAPVGSPAVSADGSVVVFPSCFTNLVPGDTNAAADVFVHNVRTGTTTRVSVTSKGQQTLYASWGAAISDNGRVVAFTSHGALDPAASTCSQPAPLLDVVPNLCGDGAQIYAHDMKTGTTVLVSATPDHTAGDGASTQASVSPDGRYVVFMSQATNLVPGQSQVRANPPAQAYLRDLARGTTRLISVGIDGAPSSDRCGDPSDSLGNVEHVMSSDNRYVLFGCMGTNLVPNFGPVTHLSGVDIYVRDLRTSRTRRVSVDSTGGLLNQELHASLSRDGRCSVFYAGNPDGLGPYAWGAQVLLHDDVTGATEFISTPLDGDGRPTSGNPASLGSDVSADGRYVAFASQASDLVRGDTNTFPDVFVRDRGRDLGIGGLAGARALTVAGATGFSSTGLVSALGRAVEVRPAGSIAATDLIGATMAYRPASSDLFARLELSGMPTFAAASPADLYGLDLTVDGTSYQVRAAKTGVGASFGLFRRDVTGLWTYVADVPGGYGTTGEEVVFAVPLAAIGAQHGAHLTNVSAFTAVGSYATGVTRVQDTVRLSR